MILSLRCSMTLTISNIFLRRRVMILHVLSWKPLWPMRTRSIQSPVFWGGLRKLCDEYNIVLIFDEVITGFRLGLQGAQGYFGVMRIWPPLGKPLAEDTRFPVSLEEKKIVSAATIASGTFAANALCVAAALATITVCEQPGFYENLERMSKKMIAAWKKFVKSIISR